MKINNNIVIMIVIMMIVSGFVLINEQESRESIAKANAGLEECPLKPFNAFGHTTFWIKDCEKYINHFKKED